MAKTNAERGFALTVISVVAVVAVAVGMLKSKESSSQTTETRVDKSVLKRATDPFSLDTAKSTGRDECKNVRAPSVAKRPVPEVLAPCVQSVKRAAKDHGRAVSALNDQMSALLEQAQMPNDYASTMIALFADRAGDTVVRDFAVQHIGLYAEARNRRGEYNPEAEESRAVRDALWLAADETQTIVAAAAFRALADLSEFDAYVDSSQLNAKLVSCVSDGSASPAARVMAAQLCGERRIESAKSRFQSLVDDPKTEETLRRAAMSSLRRLNGVSPR